MSAHCTSSRATHGSNGNVESFHSRLHEERLAYELLTTLAEARAAIVARIAAWVARPQQISLRFLLPRLYSHKSRSSFGVGQLFFPDSKLFLYSNGPRQYFIAFTLWPKSSNCAIDKPIRLFSNEGSSAQNDPHLLHFPTEKSRCYRRLCRIKKRGRDAAKRMIAGRNGFRLRRKY